MDIIRNYDIELIENDIIIIISIHLRNIEGID